MRFPRVSLRWLPAAVTILASLMLIVSVLSFGRLIRLTAGQRLDRAREIAQREVARVADPDPITGPPRLTVLGLRGPQLYAKLEEHGLSERRSAPQLAR